MKKEYVKPYLAFESFQLVAALAGSCGMPLNQSAQACSNPDYAPLFGNNVDCGENVFTPDYNEDGLCYQIFEGQTGGFLTS